MLELVPNNAKTLYLLSFSYFRKNDINKAERYINEALEVSSSNEIKMLKTEIEEAKKNKSDEIKIEEKENLNEIKPTMPSLSKIETIEEDKGVFIEKKPTQNESLLKKEIPKPNREPSKSSEFDILVFMNKNWQFLLGIVFGLIISKILSKS